MSGKENFNLTDVSTWEEQRLRLWNLKYVDCFKRYLVGTRVYLRKTRLMVWLLYHAYQASVRAAITNVWMLPSPINTPQTPHVTHCGSFSSTDLIRLQLISDKYLRMKTLLRCVWGSDNIDFHMLDGSGYINWCNTKNPLKQIRIVSFKEVNEFRHYHVALK